MMYNMTIERSDNGETGMQSQQTTVKKIVYGGLGLAHHEGRTLFLPFTAPGDLVEFTVTAQKKKCLFGAVTSIIEPSPARIEPECPVFGRCGGCHLLHLGYGDEIRLKEEWVVESLERIGRIKTAVRSVTPSPSRSGYRNHAVFRTEGGRPGFLMRESDEVIPFPPSGCLLLPPRMREAVSGLPESSLPEAGEVRVRIDRYGMVHFWGLKDVAGPPDLLMEAGGFHYPVSPGAFFQVNSFLAGTLADLVVSLPRKAVPRAVDLYCGAGFLSLPLSRISEEVIGIERDAEACGNAHAAARLNRIPNVQFRKGPAERELKRIREAWLVVADPPRSGLPAALMKDLVKLRPREIVMVSCEPPTLARDAGRLLEAGYLLSEIHLLDMFPGTFHVETVALFRRS